MVQSLSNFLEKSPMKNLIKLAPLLVLLHWHSASASSLFCAGTVEQVYVGANSQVFIQGSWHTNWTMICDLDSTWKGITGEACKSWFAMALTAHQAKSNVMVRYDNIQSTDCAALPIYGSSPAPLYFMLRP